MAESVDVKGTMVFSSFLLAITLTLFFFFFLIFCTSPVDKTGLNFNYSPFYGEHSRDIKYVSLAVNTLPYTHTYTHTPKGLIEFTVVGLLYKQRVLRGWRERWGEDSACESL